MTRPLHQKVTAGHLRRDAYLYVRQSTVRQVFENTENTRCQYALRERAVALGWPIERVNLIDTDLGKSGASSADREGFQKLVGEVGMGRAGIVLGAEWNGKLRALHDAQEELEQRCAQDHQDLGDERRRRILALCTDFPRLWNDPKAPQRERKRMVRLLLEDVTLTKGNEIDAGVRFRGGATQSLTVPLAQPAWQLRQTSAQVVAEIDALLDDHTEGQIARILNERGHLSGEGRPLHAVIVQNIRRAYGLKSRYDRLREAGMLTVGEVADLLGVAQSTVRTWRRAGLLRAHAVNDKSECLYEPLGDDAPVRYKHQGVTARLRHERSRTNPTKEVQCEA